MRTTSAAARRRVRFAAFMAFLAMLASLSWRHATSGGREAVPPRLVILVVVDTLRADHLGFYGYERSTTPNLDRWVTRGVVFDRTWATSSWTLPSFASIWTGLLPARHGAGRRPDETSDFSAIAPGLETLGTALQRGGWTAVGFLTNRFLHPDYGFARGFSQWDHAGSREWRARRAEFIVDRALAWLSQWDGGPAFVVLHVFDPHMPYDAPPPMRGRFSAGVDSTIAAELPGTARGIREVLDELDAAARERVVAAYDEEIAYVDQEVGRLLTGLDKRGLFEQSLVILTSDHGEELFDHGGFEHGHAHHEEVLRVPLVVWSAAARPGRREAPASLVDLYPTLLEGAGLDLPGGLDGRSLWPALRGFPESGDRPVAAQGNLYGNRDQETVVAWPWKRTYSPGDAAGRLFDLAADPQELEDAERAQPRVAARLERLRHQFREKRLDLEGLEARDLDDEVREELRSLGYL